MIFVYHKGAALLINDVIAQRFALIDGEEIRDENLFITIKDANTDHNILVGLADANRN